MLSLSPRILNSILKLKSVGHTSSFDQALAHVWAATHICPSNLNSPPELRWPVPKLSIVGKIDILTSSR